ncbi:MAG: hypothetical protein H7A55_09340 [Verrucomicrobiaceae bacterium]|nr:hypothetical protein [Verrucomicrobiaceae bacterium]
MGRSSSLKFVLPAAMVLLTLGACTSSRLPKTAVAKTRLVSERQAFVRDAALANELRVLQSLRLAENTAATEKFVLSLQRRVQSRDWRGPLRIEGKDVAWELQFDLQPVAAQGRPEYSASLFDRFIPASGFKLEGYDRIAAGPGAGAAFVLGIEDVVELQKERSFRPENGLYVPATVVFEFGKPQRAGGATPVRCHIVNTLRHREAKFSTGAVPIAWNVTAGVEATLANRYIKKNGLAGLLRPDKRSNDIGLFGIEAYERERIPVLFVHGLDSSPAIWRNAVNEIYADPVLSSKYLPLLFMYPSGQSVPASAAKLRESIRRYREMWDPKHDAPGFQKMVVVGHSMGGLLSRLQVIDSGDAVWKAFFSRPVGEIPWVTEETRKRLVASLKFEPQPFVKRAVFIAVPHRGSELADLGIVRWAVRLIRLPLQMADFAQTALTKDPNLLNPALLEYHSMGWSGVEMLSPGHPYFAAIDSRPIKVPYHSIIGDRGKGGGEESSDGVVPYASSHLSGAKSEVVVPYGHSCTTKPETVQEILRILRLHLRGA